MSAPSFLTPAAGTAPSPGPVPAGTAATPDIAALIVAASRSAQEDSARNADLRWIGSRYEWFRAIASSTARGKAGESIVHQLFERLGHTVRRSPDSEADRIINDIRVEIKTSSLWTTGLFKFQQLREQNYDYVICLGLCPDTEYLWIIPKAVALENATPQHTGAAGNDTRWLEITPTNPQSWLQPFGGLITERLLDAAATLNS